VQRPAPTEVSDAALRAIAVRHGLGTAPVVQLAHAGSGTTVYFLGDAYVLRVPLNDPARAAGAYTEAIAVPAARAAGVRTPRIVAFDDRRDLLPVPYAVYERVPGAPLSALGREPATVPQVWRELGHDLALLHTGVSPDGPAGQLRGNGEDPDPRPWIADFARAGYLTADEARRLLGWLDRLAPQAQAPVPPRFSHGDVNAANILVDPATLTYRALIDWGGAGWGDGAWDFCPLALRAVPFVLAGYRAVAPLDNDDAAAARIAWHHVQLALYFIRPDRHPPHALAAARIRRLLAELGWFLATCALL
jgi:aminoglycoside phosphotransferase (APT) family kinase protein